MVSPESFDRDPLRVVRVARLAAELGLSADPETIAAGAGAGRRPRPRLRRADLRRAARADRRAGPGRRAAAARGHGRGRRRAPRAAGAARHRADRLPPPRRPRPHARGPRARRRARPRPAARWWASSARAPCARCSTSRSADELTRGGALRWGALLHDIAKPRHEDGARGRRLRLPRPRRRGRADVAGDPRAPARERPPARPRRRAGAKPPAGRVPRARGARCRDASSTTTCSAAATSAPT